MQRIAITGIGAVSPFGVGRERYWNAIAAGESGTRAIDQFDASAFACRVAAPLPPFSIDDAVPVAGEQQDVVLTASIMRERAEALGRATLAVGSSWPATRGVAEACGVAPAAALEPPHSGASRVSSEVATDGARATGAAGDTALADRADPRRYSRTSLAAVVAAREAWADAGLHLAQPHAGVIVGTGAGGIDVGERQYAEFFGDGWKRVTPYAIPVSICGMVSSEISIALRLHGMSHVLSTGCTSSTDAVGYAASVLRAGEADYVLSGGADACVTPGMIFGFSRMKVVATRFNDRPQAASRPFDRARDGFVLGEGAWMLVLETEAHARARGARIYAFVEGYGATCDAYHRVQMDPDGEQIVAALTLALERSGRAVEEIGYVNYHGTSTQLNDAVEVACVKRVLGRQASRTPGSSTKSMIGHPQGASGAAGLVATALALSRGFLPPTINLEHPDAGCDLDFLAGKGRPARPAAALCNCLGFGSKNSAVVLGAA